MAMNEATSNDESLLLDNIDEVLADLSNCKNQCIYLCNANTVAISPSDNQTLCEEMTFMYQNKSTTPKSTDFLKEFASNSENKLCEEELISICSSDSVDLNGFTFLVKDFTYQVMKGYSESPEQGMDARDSFEDLLDYLVLVDGSVLSNKSNPYQSIKPNMKSSIHCISHSTQTLCESPHQAEAIDTSSLQVYTPQMHPKTLTIPQSLTSSSEFQKAGTVDFKLNPIIDGGYLNLDKIEKKSSSVTKSTRSMTNKKAYKKKKSSTMTIHQAEGDETPNCVLEVENLYSSSSDNTRKGPGRIAMGINFKKCLEEKFENLQQSSAVSVSQVRRRADLSLTSNQMKSKKSKSHHKPVHQKEIVIVEV